MFPAAKLKHFNGNATTTSTPVDFGTNVNSVYIENMSATEALLVSFDDGANFKTVGPNKFLQVDVVISRVAVKAAATTVNYEILVSIA